MGCSKLLSNSLATKQETGLPKSVLVQLALKKNVPLPTYNFTKEGDAHCPTFTATVQINGACYLASNNQLLGATKSEISSEKLTVENAPVVEKRSEITNVENHPDAWYVTTPD
jgi:dsRNA-specific ribonuclease